MAQLVECPALDFGSGHDLTVCQIEPCIRLCFDSTEPAWDSFSLSKINKLKTIQKLSHLNNDGAKSS